MVGGSQVLVLLVKIIKKEKSMPRGCKKKNVCKMLSHLESKHYQDILIIYMYKYLVIDIYIYIYVVSYLVFFFWVYKRGKRG